MSQPRFPDPARSRAVLIGSGHFTAAGLDLPDIPAVEANLTALRQVLASPDTGVLKPEFCRVLIDPTSADEVGAALSDMAAMATDLLLVYYVGHGLVDDRGRLHLALAHTQPHRARWTALPLELLHEEIANSAAATRVLVLDCCFSGRAIEAMTDDQGVISGQLDVAGTYTLTSTTANAPSHAPAGDRHTAFTGALLRALDEADPLTLDQIYVTVDRDLATRNLPRPQRRAVNAAGNLALSRGPTPHVAEPRIDWSNSDVVRFTHTQYALALSGLRVVRTIFDLILAFVCLSTYLSAYLFTITLGDDLWLPRRIIEVLTLVALLVILLRILKRKKTRVRELIVDRSGLTIRWKHAKTQLLWRDIAQVGVLKPKSGAFDRSPYYTRRHVLVVRLRPEVPTPRVVSVLSDEYRQLGYLGLCTVEGLGHSRQEMIRVLERFAGGKLVHSSRQFLDRDPRLRPEMV